MSTYEFTAKGADVEDLERKVAEEVEHVFGDRSVRFIGTINIQKNPLLAERSFTDRYLVASFVVESAFDPKKTERGDE